MSAYTKLLDKLRNHGSQVKETGQDRAVAQCPAHNDTNPSLAISVRNDSKGAVIHCHAGCDNTAILTAIGWTMSDLFDDPRMQAAWSNQNVYTYPCGRKVHRNPGKKFRQSGNTKGNSLFHSDKLGSAKTVYVPEGEKDVLAIESIGGVAVCSAMGAGKAGLADWKPLAGRDVVIIADNDKPGFDHADDIDALLDGIADSVTIKIAAVGKDVSDHIASGRGLDELVTIGNAFDRKVNARAAEIRVEREARRVVDDEQRPPATHPQVRSLSELLAQQFPPQAYRIDKVAPAGGRVIVSAQYKAGKTTLVGNMMRSLADADPFLGHFDIPAAATGIVLIDDEMSERTVWQWLSAQNIRNQAAIVDVITLRGNVGAFNLIDERTHVKWVKRLAGLGCDYLIVDCLRPILDSLGLDENHDTGRFLVTFDELLAAAAIPDACLVHHMGHAGERSRGDSRLQDWPDAVWKLVRENDEPHSPRYFSAYGRDVEVPEGRLTFDPKTRHLTYTGGSRTNAAASAALVAVIELLAQKFLAGIDGLSGRQLEDGLYGKHSRAAVRDAMTLELASPKPRIGVRSVGRANVHHILHPCSACGKPVIGGGPSHLSCAQKATGAGP